MLSLGVKAALEKDASEKAKTHLFSFQLQVIHTLLEANCKPIKDTQTPAELLQPTTWSLQPVS